MLTCSPLPITQPLPGTLTDVVGRPGRTDPSKLHLIPKHSHLLFGQLSGPESQSTRGLNEASQGPANTYITPQTLTPSHPGSGIFDKRTEQRILLETLGFQLQTENTGRKSTENQRSVWELITPTGHLGG